MDIVAFNPFYFLFSLWESERDCLSVPAFPSSQACSGQRWERGWPPRLPPPPMGGQRCRLQVPRAPGSQCHPASGHSEARPGGAARNTVPWEVWAATAESLVQGLFCSEWEQVPALGIAWNGHHRGRKKKKAGEAVWTCRAETGLRVCGLNCRPPWLLHLKPGLSPQLPHH